MHEPRPHNIGPNLYDATNPEIVARQEALIDKIIEFPAEQLAPDGWEDEEIRQETGFELAPNWQTVPNPWVEGEQIAAAPIVAEDDEGVRHFAIIGQRRDGALQYYGF